LGDWDNVDAAVHMIILLVETQVEIVDFSQKVRKNFFFYCPSQQLKSSQSLLLVLLARTEELTPASTWYALLSFCFNAIFYKSRIVERVVCTRAPDFFFPHGAPFFFLLSRVVVIVCTEHTS